MIDIVCFLLVPVLVWRLTRSIVPMAVMPILTGLAVAVAADRFGFDKAVFGPSRAGESIGWIGVLLLTFSAGLETRAMANGPRMGIRTFFAAIAALALPFLLGFAAVQVRSAGLGACAAGRDIAIACGNGDWIVPCSERITGFGRYRPRIAPG